MGNAAWERFELKQEVDSKPGPGFALLVLFWLFALSFVMLRVLQEIGVLTTTGGLGKLWTWLWLFWGDGN